MTYKTKHSHIIFSYNLSSEQYNKIEPLLYQQITQSAYINDLTIYKEYQIYNDYVSITYTCTMQKMFYYIYTTNYILKKLEHYNKLLNKIFSKYNLNVRIQIIKKVN